MIAYSEQHHRQHCTLHAFEEFGALYMRYSETQLQVTKFYIL